MLSVTFNASAAVALRVLSATNRDIEATQIRMSTGYKINSAQDNPSLWAIASDLKSDLQTTGAIRDWLSVASARTDVTSGALTAVSDVLGQMKSKLLLAQGGDRTVTQADIQSLQDQLVSLVKASSFSGVNWLDGSAESVDIAISYNREDGLDTISLDLTKATLIDGAGGGILDKKTGTKSGKSVLELDITGARGPDYTKMLQDLDAAMASVTEAGTSFGSLGRRLDMQDTFLQTLEDVTQRSVGRLVNSDVTEESARLAALQVRQQLAIQSLQMANQSQMAILDLFR